MLKKFQKYSCCFELFNTFQLLPLFFLGDRDDPSASSTSKIRISSKKANETAPHHCYEPVTWKTPKQSKLNECISIILTHPSFLVDFVPFGICWQLDLKHRGKIAVWYLDVFLVITVHIFTKYLSETEGLWPWLGVRLGKIFESRVSKLASNELPTWPKIFLQTLF